MNNDLEKILLYWRVSLADSALGDGKFTQRDRKRFIEVSGETVRSGKLLGPVLERVFGGQKSAKSVAVRFWPLVMARKTSHGAARVDGLPEIVAPVVTEATVERDGLITPLRNTLARDVLSPVPSGKFSIGSVDDLDSFLAETSLPDMIVEGAWPEYLAHCRKMVDAVAGGWPNGDDDYQSMGFGFLELAEDASATIRNIVDLYDKLLTEKPDTPLLSQVAQPRKTTAGRDPQIEREFSSRLGHSNPNFPLSEHQRQVLTYLDVSTAGEVVAVNGPPGTGKTRMLLSAVASCWIRAALKGEESPVIVAASPLRQTTGFVESLLMLVGLDWSVPDFSTLCRRQKTLAVAIPYKGSAGPLHLLVDSTGIKAEGEGEWNARKHGGSKRCLWRKIHIGIDEETLEIRAIEVTSSSIDDAPMLPDLLSQIAPDQELGSVTADGAYDTRKCHDAIAARNAHAVIPPRKTAKMWKPNTSGARARNEAVRSSKYLGRSLWRNLTGYYRRSRVETKMHCVKLLGQRLSARDFERQVAEIQIRAAILNGFTVLGIPRTVAVG